VGFSSCSDDEEEGRQIPNIDITIDGKKMAVPNSAANLIMNLANYTKESNSLYIQIYFGDAPFSSITIYGVSTGISAGNDITKYGDFSINLDSETKFISGKITLTKFDTQKKSLSLEFTNVVIKDHTISGSAILPLDIYEYD
jgi:hypothetical protein